MADHFVRPLAVLGLDSPYVSPEAINVLLEREGRAFTPAKRPKGVRRMKPGECYANASKLVMDNRMWGDATLNYAEGYLSLKGSPFAILHGWALTPDGTVVDPTIKDPEKHDYFGIVHDWDAYRKHVLTHGVWGILGGDYKTLADWLKNVKGIEPRQMDPEFAAFLAGWEATA